MSPPAIETHAWPTVDEHHKLLRDEISFLGEQLGAVIRQLESDAAFECVERIRHLARDFRQGNDAARIEPQDRARGDRRAEAADRAGGVEVSVVAGIDGRGDAVTDLVAGHGRRREGAPPGSQLESTQESHCANWT